MRITLGDIKNSEVPAAVGLNKCQPEFTLLVNNAVSQLAQAIKCWGSYARMKICITKGCLTWPREVMTIEGFNLCGLTVPIRNAWFEFQTYVPAPRTDCRGDCNIPQLLERGLPPIPQFRDFTGDSKVRIYPNAADVDKRVLVQGDSAANGVAVRTVDSVTGAVVYGEYLTLALPYVESTTIFKEWHLTGAQKPYTDYNLRVTAVNQADSVETDIALWEPSETNPAYRRNFLTNRPRCGVSLRCRDHGDGCQPRDLTCTNVSAEILYRVSVIPAVVDSDWLYIGRMDAIEYKMRAIQQQRRNEYADAEYNNKMAIKALREELEAYSPMQSMVVTQLPEGTASFGRVYGFQNSM